MAVWTNSLTLIEHAIEPGKELLGAVVGVEDDGDSVNGSNGSDVVGSGNGTSNGSLLLLGGVGDGLAGEEGGTTLGSLEDDWGLGLLSGLESGNTTRTQMQVSYVIRPPAEKRELVGTEILTRWSWK